MIGETLSHFKILEMLGRGGMGVVYKALDTSLKRTVALKILPAEVVHDPGRKRRFILEAQSASALNHPSIVTIYEIGSSGGVDFIAMEYVEGQPLQKIIGRTGTELNQALKYAIQIADALSRAHERGIIHRDLKPQNIMITNEDEVKVLDFGLAMLVEPAEDETLSKDTTVTQLQTRAGTVLGTAHYMSPEQVEGKRLDARSDIFSFGTVLYEIIAGKRPFTGESLAAVQSSILRDPPQPLLAERGELPAEIGRIVDKTLEKDREYRYQHMQDVLSDLKKLRRDLSGAQPVPNVKAVRRRYRLWALASSLIVLIALLGVLWRLHHWQSTSSGTQQSQLHLISTFPGSHGSPSFSPDAGMIAFVSDVAGVSQVWIKNLAQGDPIQITFGDTPAGRPRWSPLNDQIVFHRKDGIWSVPPLGGRPQRIINEGYNANWSWDGKRLVFEKPDEIWLASADGSNERKVEFTPAFPRFVVDRLPSLSPDGSQIAFFQSKPNSPHGDIWVVAAAGGQARRLTFDGVQGGAPVWTPDGRSIVFSSERAGSMTLWRVAAAGGTPEPVTTGTGEDTAPEVSRDGRELVFTNTRNSYVLKLLDPATGSSRDVMEARDKKIVYPSFSADGRRIAFFRLQNEGDVHVFIIDEDGKNLTQITRTRGEQNIFPQWSGDGVFLYFFQTRPTASFRKTSVSGGQTTEVVPGWVWGNIRFPHVDASGRYIVYQKSTVCAVWDFETGKETTFKFPLGRPRWSRDGKALAGESPDGIVLCPVEGGACRTIAKGSAPVWSGDESRVYFQRRGNLTDGWELWSVSRDGLNEKRIAELRPMLPMDPFYDVSVKDRVVWVEFKPGSHELWLLSLSP